ncbi:MAG: hypothetical protein H7A37_09425 [Chlamydiales bacterium]|nr:hypothetical protein [Chlamydiales bacterium]
MNPFLANVPLCCHCAAVAASAPAAFLRMAPPSSGKLQTTSQHPHTFTPMIILGGMLCYLLDWTKKKFLPVEDESLSE